MIRASLLVLAVIASVSQAEIIEYSMWGSGKIFYEYNDSNSILIERPGSGGYDLDYRGYNWTASYTQEQSSDYLFRFYADTDNIVSDGMGGYMLAIEAATSVFSDGATRSVNAAFVFMIDARGRAGFHTDNGTFYLESGDFSSYDMGAEFDAAELIRAIQNYSGGVFDAIFAAEFGAAAFDVNTVNFSATHVESIPRIPAPGALGVLGLGGLMGLRRRR